MELDDLKQTWKQTSAKKNINTDIMELIQNKNYGPLAAMKRAFRKQIRLMSIIPLVLLITNMNDLNIVFTSVMFWSYVAFCIGIIVFAAYNYRIVSKLEDMDRVVRSNLEHQINLLEKRMRWEIIGMRSALLFFIGLTEVLPYFQHYRMLDHWHSLSPVVRISAYAGLLLLQYFIKRRKIERNIGIHLAYLKKLMNEMVR